MECTGQANAFELIQTVKLETDFPERDRFGNKVPPIYNHCGVMVA